MNAEKLMDAIGLINNKYIIKCACQSKPAKIKTGKTAFLFASCVTLIMIIIACFFAVYYSSKPSIITPDTTLTERPDHHEREHVNFKGNVTMPDGIDAYLFDDGEGKCRIYYSRDYKQTRLVTPDFDLNIDYSDIRMLYFNVFHDNSMIAVIYDYNDEKKQMLLYLLSSFDSGHSWNTKLMPSDEINIDNAESSNLQAISFSSAFAGYFEYIDNKTLKPIKIATVDGGISWSNQE